MDSTLENYVPGQDFGTLRISLADDDDLVVHASGQRGSSYLDLPLYAYQARELVQILAPLAEEPDAG